MKSISLILGVAVFCSASAVAEAATVVNYSLWPRRPDELEQARALVTEQKGAEALHLLQPFLNDSGIAGREARQIVGRINTPRYLTREHPGAYVYTVQRGDTVQRIARQQSCPAALIMLLNGLTEPAGLRIGQKLLLARVSCRLEIRLKYREICVWDGDTLVADYALSAVPAGGQFGAGTQTQLAAIEGESEGMRVPETSSQFPSSDRRLRLENGVYILPERGGAAEHCLRMPQRDLNELSLLLSPGAEVVWSN